MDKISCAIHEALERLMYEDRVKFRFDEITLHTLLGDNGVITEGYNWILKRNSWEINNYKRFLDIVKRTPSDKKGFLTWHGMEEITQNDWVVYTLKGYDVAFALHYISDGQIDICNLVNNSQLHGIGSYVLQFAKSEGGTQMDNYRGIGDDNGKLGDLYRANGFDRQTWRDKFNPEYQPADQEWQFDTEKYGYPDVEGLELSKHRMKYNNPQRQYKDKFDKKINQKFQKEK